MIIQLILLAFIAFVLNRVSLQFRRGEISGREFFLWLVFWALVGVAVLFPRGTDLLARLAGVERGADLLVYVSVLVLFFVVYKLMVRLDRVDREITTVVRELALKKPEKKDGK